MVAVTGSKYGSPSFNLAFVLFSILVSSFRNNFGLN